MCGILAILGLETENQKQNTDSKEKIDSNWRAKAISLSKLLRHRGPDWSGCVIWNDYTLLHERLSIIDIDSGAQPIVNKEKTMAMSVNGEIYNHKQLESDLSNNISNTKYEFQTRSDCESPMYYQKEYGDQFLEKICIDGMFAFVIVDRTRKRWIAARDHVGIIPLYIGWASDGSVQFASEMKALIENCKKYEVFRPGHYYSSQNHCYKQWYKPQQYSDPEYIPNGQAQFCLKTLREKLEQSVLSHMMSDVPYGMLLSGGLDSSLVASIVAKNLRVRHNRQRRNSITMPPQLVLQSFCIGVEGSPDLEMARKVAEHIGTKHHSWTFTIQEGLDALEEVIRHIETYDITTVRASTPMFLLARKIRSTGVKMVLSGEGADEIFGGYLYFHKAPNSEEFHRETVRKIKALHMFDCLRANKATMAQGIEARVPFLDREFLDYAMSIDPKHKMINENDGIEKYILRKAFDIEDENGKPVYLPKEVLWRQKEQFSDGVGYSQIDSIQSYAEEIVSNSQMSTAKYLFEYNTPKTKEAYLYRQIFSKYFPGECAAKTVLQGDSIACSTPIALKWDKSFQNKADPSGRSVGGVHASAYE